MIAFFVTIEPLLGGTVKWYGDTLQGYETTSGLMTKVWPFRDKAKAESTQNILRQLYPHAIVSIVECDLRISCGEGNLKSIWQDSGCTLSITDKVKFELDLEKGEKQKC